MTIEQAVSLSDRQINGFLGAYFERKKFEARVMLSVVAESLQQKSESASVSDIAAMGFGIKGF